MKEDSVLEGLIESTAFCDALPVRNLMRHEHQGARVVAGLSPRNSSGVTWAPEEDLVVVDGDDTALDAEVDAFFDAREDDEGLSRPHEVHEPQLGACSS